MSFITYAQNFEDVLLWRALQHVTPGYYVDVGANDPVEHSVTKSFYDAGWRGINIEPLPAFHAAFMAQRPEDVNLAVAAGADEGEIELFDVPDVNGWASSAPDVAAAHRAEGYDLVELKVPLRTLNSIFSEYVTRDIHFLKIDVEGFEREVLLGLDLRRWRPWIVVVEATMPNSRETNHETWENLVTAHDYRFAYFDGLNRYYVAGEHPELMAHLQVQANVFDAFISSHLDNAWRDNAALRQLVETQESRAATLDQRLAENDARYRADIEAREQAFNATAAAAAQNENDRIAAEARLAAVHAEAEQLRGRLEASLAREAADAEALKKERAHVEWVEAQLQSATSRHQELDAQLQAATARNDDLGERLHAANAWGNDLDTQLRAANAWGNELAQRLQAVHQSTSWRVSKPVRMVGSVVRRMSGPGRPAPEAADAEAPRANTTFKSNTLQRLRTVARSAPVRKYVMPPLLRIPGVEQRLLRLAVTLRENTVAPVVESAPLPPELSDLSPRARQALSDLERARRRYPNP